PIEPGSYELVSVPSELRLVEVEVRAPAGGQGGAPVRLSTPVATGAPIGWVVAAIARLASLPPGAWIAWSDGVPVDGDRLVVDVLGGGSKLLIGPRP
ncbi:MAG: hypothetical protein ABMB14_24275, partial [Myxococcota bacterium]